VLATHGARVVVTGRSKERVDSTVKALKAARPTAAVEGYVVDLASFSSVDALVKELKSKVKALHILVLSAAVFIPPFSKTAEGFEVTVGVNYLSHVYLSQCLLPLLKAAKSSRVVVLTSALASLGALNLEDIGGEKTAETNMTSYGTSKLQLALYALALNARFKEAGIEAFAVNPGQVSTPMLVRASSAEAPWYIRAMILVSSFLAVSPSVGALSTLYAATAPELAGKGGGMYGPNEWNVGFTKEWRIKGSLATQENADKLLDETLKLIVAKGGKGMDVK